MYEDRLLLIHVEQLLKVLKNKRLAETYRKLLTISHNNTIDFTSYEHLAKVLGYKTRSGCWKAVQELIKIGLVGTYTTPNTLYLSFLFRGAYGGTDVV